MATYAVVQLSYNGRPHFPGEQLDGKIPDDVLKTCVERGEASNTKPKPDDDSDA